MTERFTDLLQVRELELDRFEITSAGTGFLFGGLTMAVGLTAAARTVPQGLVPRSLHASFHAGGSWGQPIGAAVDRVNDTRSYATRRVSLGQGETAVAVIDVAFRRDRGGPDLTGEPRPAVPPPDELEPERVSVPVPVLEVRYVHATTADGERVHPYWARFPQALPADPALHGAALAFASDYLVIYTPFEPGSGTAEGAISRTLEHSIWFHRPIDASRWLLFDARPLSLTDGHFVSRGTVHDEGGALVASFVQEGFVREAPPSP